MGIRYRKSIKIGKGMKLSFGKKGASMSFGTKGLHYTINTSGRRTSSVGIPGTGVSFVSSSGGRKRSSKRKSSGGRAKTGPGNMSYTNASSAVQRQQAYEQKRLEEEYARNCEMVDDFNELLDRIRSIHEECSEPVDWIALRDTPEPFNKMFMGPFEMEAQKAFNGAKPGLLGRLIPATDRMKMQRLEQEIREAQEKDRQIYSDWENLRILANHVLGGDIDSYFYVVSETHPFDEILDYGSDFDIGTDFPDLMEVEFHAKTSKVVPNHVLSMTKTGKLSSKQMTKTMHYDIAQDYVCSCVLRVAREMFALLPINRVVIHAVDTVSDTAGHEYDDTVLSVLIMRHQLDGINFELIDPSDTIETFKSNMVFKKTQGLKPVPRIEI